MMKNAKKRGLAILLAGLLAVPGATIAANAASPTAMRSAFTGPSTAASVQKVDHRRWHHRHHRHGRHRDGIHPGAAIALGLVGSLIAQGLSQDAAYSAVDRCDARFRSFDRDTGLYTTYGGEKRLCPYLR